MCHGFEKWPIARAPRYHALDMLADVAFRIDLPHGRCVGVRVPAGAEQSNLQALAPGLATLADEERAYLETLSPMRKPSWLAGRIALHEALQDLRLDHGPILTTTRGAPELPDGAIGSISHKQTLAVGLARPKQDSLHIGIDIEPVPPLPTEPGWSQRPDISSRVLTSDELAALAAIPESSRRRHVVLCFSLKEALYKAINPLVGRYVSFKEATVVPAPDGSVAVTLTLKQQEGPFVAEARWLEISGHLLTTACVRAA
jgi:enterobactin synthetase component D